MLITFEPKKKKNNKNNPDIVYLKYNYKIQLDLMINQVTLKLLDERKDVRFSFVYLDTDLYPSIRCGIELLYPKLLKGGIMVFDEYNIAEWPGETSAVHDALGADVALRTVPMTRQPTAYLVK